jgi:hypothetical protein
MGGGNILPATQPVAGQLSPPGAQNLGPRVPQGLGDRLPDRASGIGISGPHLRQPDARSAAARAPIRLYRAGGGTMTLCPPVCILRHSPRGPAGYHHTTVPAHVRTGALRRPAWPLFSTQAERCSLRSGSVRAGQDRGLGALSRVSCPQPAIDVKHQLQTAQSTPTRTIR